MISHQSLVFFPQAAFGCLVERELTLDGLEELREGGKTREDLT